MFPYSLVYSQNCTVYFKILWFWLLFPEPYVHLRWVYMFIKLMKYFYIASDLVGIEIGFIFLMSYFQQHLGKSDFIRDFKSRSIWSKSFTALTVRRRAGIRRFRKSKNTLIKYRHTVHVLWRIICISKESTDQRNSKKAVSTHFERALCFDENIEILV